MKNLSNWSSNQKSFIAVFCLSVFVFVVVLYYMNFDSGENINSYRFPGLNSMKKTEDHKINSKYIFCLIKTTPKALKNNSWPLEHFVLL